MSDLVKTPERLKQSILQEAMQGKLTKQLPSDGNADDLLQSIRQKKDQLIETGRIRKHKELSSINKKDIPFDIPDNWSWVKLGEIANIRTGTTPAKKYRVGKDCVNIPFVSPRDLDNNIITNINRSISVNKASLNKVRFAQPNSIFVVGIGTIGKTGIPHKKVAFNQQIHAINGYNKHINKFIFYWLRSNVAKNQFKIGGTVISIVNKTKFSNFIIPLPPLSEQHRIVRRLDEILPKVDDLNKDVVKLDQIRTKFPHHLKQSLLLEAMKGHLTQQLPSDGTADDLLQKIKQKKQKLIQAGRIRKHKKLPPISKSEIPFKIPKNWKWVRLGNISKVLMGQSPKKDTVSKGIADRTHYEFHQGKTCFGRIYLKKSYKITTSNSKIVQPGTILMSVRAPVGSINRTNRLIAIGRGLCGINPICLNVKYIYLYLDSQKYALQSKSTGTTFKAINKTNIKNFICPLPPLAEQHRIVSIIQKCFSLL